MKGIRKKLNYPLATKFRIWYNGSVFGEKVVYAVCILLSENKKEEKVMKVITKEEDCFVIMNVNQGLENPMFWRKMPWGGFITRVWLDGASRFYTKEEAEAVVRNTPNYGPAKVVKIRFTETAEVAI